MKLVKYTSSCCEIRINELGTLHYPLNKPYNDLLWHLYGGNRCIVCSWGDRCHPVKNEGGTGKFVLLNFWTVWSLLSQNCKKSILAQKSYGSYFYDIAYRTSLFRSNAQSCARILFECPLYKRIVIVAHACLLPVSVEALTLPIWIFYIYISFVSWEVIIAIVRVTYFPYDLYLDSNPG